ncbi:MAG: hypothetical protein AB1634_11965, partial [Thermodesulfobacteriota bacterium]
MRPFELVAITPPFTAEPGVALAASRAGGLGLLDLEHVHDPELARRAVTRLAAGRPARTGLKLAARDAELVAELCRGLPAGCRTVVLTGLATGAA